MGHGNATSHSHPRYASLGEAYAQSGEKQLAIENYKKALTRNPENSDARQKLAALEGTPAVK